MLLSTPHLSLLDKLLTALDVRLKKAIHQQLRSLHDEFSIPTLYPTHDPAEAIEIHQEVLILEYGGLIPCGNPLEFLR